MERRLDVMRRIAMLPLAAALVVSGTALAAARGPAASAPVPTPSQTCGAMRSAMNMEVFNTTYGANANDTNAFGKCVSQQRRALVTFNRSASKACRAEREDSDFPATHGQKSFAQHYGKRGPSTPLRNCVSEQTKSMVATLRQRRVLAATACWGQRQASPDSFNARWKTFADCVAKDARIM